MLAWATLRQRWVGFVGSFVAIALGVAVLTASLAVYASAQPAVPDRLAGAAVVVQSPAAASETDLFTQYVPWPDARVAELAAALGGIPGVSAAVPDRSFYAQVLRDGKPLDDPPAGDPLGHAWSTAGLAPFRLAAGTPPDAPGEVVLDRAYGFEPGDTAIVLLATGPTTWTVTGTVDGPGIYVSDAIAAPLAGGVTAIGLTLAPGADLSTVEKAVRSAVEGDGSVLTGDARKALEPETHVRTRWIGTQLLVVTTLLAAFATIFVMASTSALNAYQRRRELALLRAVGATPRQVRRLLLGEALLVGAAAAVVGAAAGAAFTPAFGWLLVRGELEPSSFEARITVLPVAAAIAMGLVTAVLGAWAASRRSARVRPVEALREAAVDRRAMTAMRWGSGILFAAAGVGGAALTPIVDADASMTAALLSAMALIVALALLAPVIIPPVVVGVTLGLGRFGGATGLLVRESAVTSVRRTAATVAPVLLSVGFAVLVFGMVQTASPAFGVAEARSSGGDTVVSPEGTPGLSDAAVAAIPGSVMSTVASVAFVEVPSGPAVPVDVIGGNSEALARAGVRLTGPDAMAVSATAASAHDWRPGGTARLVFPDGERAALRVAAVLPDTDLPSPVLMTREAVRAHDPSALTPVAYVTGPRPSTVGSAVVGLGASAVDPMTFSSDEEEDRLVWLFVLIMIGMSVGYTGIAVANTIVMATGDRRSDFVALRLTGATTTQVLRTVLAETGLVVALGTALGFVVALPALVGIRVALEESVGAPVELRLPWPQIGAVVLACAALALLAALAATRLALRTPALPVERL